MENEKFQELVLQHLKTLTDGQAHIEGRMNRLESKFDKLELRMENEVIDKIKVLLPTK